MAKKSSNHTKPILKLLWQASQPYKWRRNLALISTVLTVSVGVFVSPLIVSQILESIQHGGAQNINFLWTLVFWFAVSKLWSEIIGWRLVLYLVWTFETAMQRDLYSRIFQKLTSQSLFFHSNRFGGSLVSQTGRLVSSAERFWDMIIWSITPLAISLVGSIIVLSFLFWQYAIFLSIISVLFLITVYFGSKPMAKLSELEAKSSNKISGHLADVVSNILAVKASGAEQSELKDFDKTVKKWRKSSLKSMSKFLQVSTIYSTINTSILVGAVAFSVYAAQSSFISVGAIYLIVSYTTSVARELWNMNNIMRSYNKILGDSKEMVDILSTPAKLVDTSNAKKLNVNHGEIKLKNVTFTHDEGEGDTLFRDFSLNIAPGEKIGLVGSSGSGKTTLTKLLMRFADIDSGEILIDGQDIATVAQSSLRSKIAYVPQEPLLFHRSIHENISYGKPNATDAEIEQAAKQAGAYDFIIKLKDGFNTEVGERGVKLSGGQRQRIAIARAILKNAPILILDEATSALDSESESLIQKSLETLMKNRTSIVIAHRLSTIAKLDRIIVMNEGRIVENGTHSELLNKKHGIYAKLWTRQSGGFIEE